MRPCPNQGISLNPVEGLSKTMKTLIITVVPYGIRDQHLPITSLERYRHMSKLDANEPHSEGCARTHELTQLLTINRECETLTFIHRIQKITTSNP
jgi:hypothetical protein